MSYFRDGDDVIYFYDEDQINMGLHLGKMPITKEQADLIIAQKQEEEFQAMSYKEKRRERYPEIGDQLDALFHAGVFPQEMHDKIKAVKDSFPKES